MTRSLPYLAEHDRIICDDAFFRVLDGRAQSDTHAGPDANGQQEPRRQCEPLQLGPEHGHDDSFRQGCNCAGRHMPGRETRRGASGGVHRDLRDGGRGRLRPERHGEQAGCCGRSQPPARQPGPEQIPSTTQTAPEGPVRASQPACGLLVTLALQVAEHHGRSTGFGQPGELLVHELGLLATDRLTFDPIRIGRDARPGHGRLPRLVLRRRADRTASFCAVR